MAAGGAHLLMGLGLVVALAAGCNIPAGGEAPTGVPTFTLPPVLPTTLGPTTLTPSNPLDATPLPTLTDTPGATVTALMLIVETPTEVASPTAFDAGLPPLPADLLLSDDFDVPAQRWYAYGDETSASGLEGGVYYLSMNAAGRWAWRLGPVGTAARDIVIRSEARLANGEPNGVYGFICRYESATLSFYNFALTGDGRYRIARVSNGAEWTMLVDFGEPSAAIRPATQWNQVEVGCVGPTLWLRVNDILLATVQDVTYVNPGEFGFWAQTRASATHARAEFDNLVILATP